MQYNEGFKGNINNQKEKNSRVSRNLPPFIPSKKFIGAKKGYIFKMDEAGLGYYIDN